jgi:hypothetical protein
VELGERRGKLPHPGRISKSHVQSFSSSVCRASPCNVTALIRDTLFRRTVPRSYLKIHAHRLRLFHPRLDKEGFPRETDGAGDRHMNECGNREDDPNESERDLQTLES